MPSPLFYGNSTFASDGVTLTADDFTIDQSSATYTRSWTGTEAAVNTKADAILVSGGRASVSRAGGVFRVIGTFATDPSAAPEDEVPLDSYSFTTEPFQADIYTHPLAAPYLESLGADTEHIHIAKKTLEEYITRGLAPTAEDPVFDGSAEGLSAAALYYYRVKGGTHYTINRPVFRRRRQYSLAYTSRRQIENLPKFYSRSALISTFGIPAGIAALIPDDPTDSPPVGTAWGWEKRQDEAQTVDGRRGTYLIEEQLDFAHAAYSTYFYTQVT